MCVPAARDKENSLESDLKKEEEKANGALLSLKIEEQKAAGLVALNEEIKSHNTALEKRNEDLFVELKNCQDKLLKATEEKAKAVGRLNERSKKSDRNSSKKAVKNSAGNGVHSGEKPTPNTCFIGQNDRPAVLTAMDNSSLICGFELTLDRGKLTPSSPQLQHTIRAKKSKR